MSLHEGKVGSSYIVKGIEIETAVARRLQSLGMVEGAVVDIINGKSNGTLIIKVRGTRFAIGRRIASAIMVKEAA
ncbi:FeoA family protein [Cuneatibacter caecimuris]|uniref:Ferrous iron transport protein A n=1 Tax=Cuneatibacter caecimuris TaxID=1796618 RepID=A0A4Q7PJW6_9FIRM|nr:FeoA domain-containing protein [Cuneatibacter caecimuris]RZT00993.1 ferrous iron transport protein A [Cuneatibacter caecimuris]